MTVPTATAVSANSKLARFRALMDERRLSEEAGGTPSSLLETGLPRSAASVPKPTAAAGSSSKSSSGARSWPAGKQARFDDENAKRNDRNGGGARMDLNFEMEQEHKMMKPSAGRGGKAVEDGKSRADPVANGSDGTRGGNKAPNEKGGKSQKENFCPNNFSAMKQIMRRKQMANAARKQLDSSAGGKSSSSDEKKSNDIPAKKASSSFKSPANRDIDQEAGRKMSSDEKETAVSPMDGAVDNSRTLSLDEKDAWAMLGNHLDESAPGEFAITPAKWILQNASDGGSSSASHGGASGVLSFLGESPLFDRSVSDEGEAERNLERSAEKVKKLEERLLRSPGGMLSPVKPSKEDGEDHRGRGVTFAIQGGWETPSANEYSDRRKSPFVAHRKPTPFVPKAPTTPSSALGESMEAQANPMNESAIVSDDEASGEDPARSPSPMKGIGSDAEDEGERRWDAEFGAGLTPEDEEDGDAASRAYSDEFDAPRDGEDAELLGSPEAVGSGRPDMTPTRASLLERNRTLVKEVRFADQTCVELSERKRFYKEEAGRLKRDLGAAGKENSLLRVNHELTLQENARLKVLVESFRVQKRQAEAQVEAYRTQIAVADGTHRTSLKGMEDTYRSHAKNSEGQIDSLNERLRQSHDANAALQSKLDDVHGKWESKLQSDAASKELIASLKERAVASAAAAAAKEASAKAMQARIEDLQKMQDQHANEIQRERNERELVEHDRDELRDQCDSLHRQLTEWVQTSDVLGDVFFNEDGSRNEDFAAGTPTERTPVKRLRLDASGGKEGAGADGHPRTPTSNLLARTLRSELERRQTVAEKLEGAERKVAKLKDKLSDARMDVEEAKADNALLEEDLEEKSGRIAALEVALGEKDGRIARLNEELEVLIRVEGDAPASADGAESASSGPSADSAPSESSDERDSASVLEEKLEAVEETLEYTDGELEETKARLADTQELLEETAGELERSKEELADYEAQADGLFRKLTKKEVECAEISTFSTHQTKTLEMLKEKLSRSDTVNAELRTQLLSCFQSLVALEKILRTYEDIDGLVGKKMSEQSRKVGRLLGTMQQYVHEGSAPPARDMESGLLMPASGEERSAAESGSDDYTSTSSASSYEGIKSEQITLFQEQLEELRGEVAAAEAERDEANEQLQKAHRFLQEFRDELAKQEREHAQEATSLKERCEELEGKLSEATTDLRTCREEKQSLSRTTSAAENELAQQMSVVRGNNAELIQENEKLRVDLQSLELRLEDEGALLRAAREEAEGSRQDVSNAKAAFECLTAEASLTKAKLEKDCRGLREAVVQKEEDLRDCREDLSKAQASFQEQSELLKANCDELEAKLTNEEKGRLTAEASLDGASRQIANLEAAITEKEEECKEKEAELEDLIVSLKQGQHALGEAEKERGEAANTIEDLQHQLQEKTSVMFAYEEAIIGYKDDIRKLNNELQTTILEKNNRIQMLEQGLSKRQTLFTEQLDRTKEERDASTAELTDMIERLQNELHSSNKTHQESGERAKLAINNLEEEILGQNETLKDLEEETILKQARLEEKARYLDEAQNEIARVTDRLNSLEMDYERMMTKHQDESEEYAEERNRVEGEKKQLEEQMHLLRSNIEEVEESRGQQRDEIAALEAQNASMQKKCNIFKDKVKSLNEKNRAWEESHKTQSNDLVLYGMEISRLNGRVSDLKSQLIRQGHGRHIASRGEVPSSSQMTPQNRTDYLGHPSTM